MSKAGLTGIIMLLAVSNVKAQTDTTFYFKDNKIQIREQEGTLKVQVSNEKSDSAETLLFEGTYGEDYSSEASINFTFKKLNMAKKEHKYREYDHNGSLFFGFSNLADRGLNIGGVKDAALQYSSYELGFQCENVRVPLSKQHEWLFYTGIGLRFHRYNADNNTAFRIVDNRTVQTEAEEGTSYKVSKLTAWYLTVPAMIKWQNKTGKHAFYMQAGLEGGLRFFSRSKIKYIHEGETDKRKETIGKKMNMNPLTLDAKIGFGYGIIGLYARYGLVRIFRAGRGPDAIPVSVGVVVNFRYTVGIKQRQ
ncbi:MAG: hypothetical protein LBQ64_06730 [Bacteroidales bacterium]|jgi:hypothetical protein|nr:hypothetical protein [Bacteroidales bacterium]